jgi:antidote-toxin recognition MazE-like antitoxin
MTAGAMLTHLTKPFDTSGKSAARRHHRGACDRWVPCQTPSKPAQSANLGIEYFAVTCYVPTMASTPKKTKPQTPKQRMASRRERLRARGLRPVQHWVPDLRDPKVLAEIRREIKLMAKHPENDAIDDWLDAIRDPKDWS